MLDTGQLFHYSYSRAVFFCPLSPVLDVFFSLLLERNFFNEKQTKLTNSVFKLFYSIKKLPLLHVVQWTKYQDFMILICDEPAAYENCVITCKCVWFFSSNSSCKSSLTDLSQISTVSEDEKETVPAVRILFDYIWNNSKLMKQLRQMYALLSKCLQIKLLRFPISIWCIYTGNILNQ